MTHSLCFIHFSNSCNSKFLLLENLTSFYFNFTGIGVNYYSNSKKLLMLSGTFLYKAQMDCYSNWSKN